jgi:hypothetical protein
MKKLFIGLMFIFMFISMEAQIFDGFWQPVKRQSYYDPALEKSVDRAAGIWLMRMSAGVSANLFTYNKETKKIEQDAFSKFGLGLSYAHYKDGEVPYNDFSVNAFMFFPADGDIMSTSLAVTVGALQFIQVGCLYDFTLKKFGVLTGLKYTF